MKPSLLPRFACITFAALTTVIAADPPTPNGTLLFQNLRKFSTSFSVDDPTIIGNDLNGNQNSDGPKGLAGADIDGDGRNDLIAANTDGTVAVLFGGAGGGMEPAIFLLAGNPTGLRDVITANVKGDPRREIIAAHPFDGKLYVFSVVGGPGSRTMSSAQVIPTWNGARSVAAGDFNGDGNTDLVVAGSGMVGGSLAEFRGDGAGNFTQLAPLPQIDAGEFDGESARPVFTMHVWRQSGESRDRLVVTHAYSNQIWFLSSPVAGQPLAVTSTLGIPDEELVYDLTMGFFSPQSRVTGQPDLVTAATFAATVYVRRFANGGYPMTPDEQLAVPGGPRGLAVADVNNDSWPDLFAASRYGNTLYLFLNDAGALKLSSQTPTGASPRDVVSVDLNGNGFPDAAVINRNTHDITACLIDPTTGCFLVSPHIQKNTGGASSIAIRDLDSDGRAELLYLNASTGDANIQQLTPAGQLGNPVRYSMGARVQSLSFADINNDGRLDLQSTSLGNEQTPGGLFYRLQNSDHTFGPLTTPPEPPSPLPGGIPMLREITGDFDNDGLFDKVTLFWDCRIALYKGTATGLSEPRIESFIYESRALVSFDLDGDGDLDLVGVGAAGDLAVVENDGRWFVGGPFLRRMIPRNNAAAGAYLATAKDENSDGYIDLTVLSKNHITRWNGAPSNPFVTFQFASTTPVPPTISAVMGSNNQPPPDYNGDGSADVFTISPGVTNATFFSGAGVGGQWWNQPTFVYGIPASSVLAAGDLDGDGKPDLVGAGEYIWIALSGTVMPGLVPTAVPTTPPGIASVVINEVIASTRTYVAPGSVGPTDCVEIYNSSGAAVNLTGWKLRRTIATGETAPDFSFPATTLAAGARAIVYCSNSAGLWSAPFKLPDDGATIRLLNAAGEVSDQMTYGEQQPDVSFSRLTDASRALVYNPIPNIGSINYDNGNLDPVITFKGVEPSLLKTNRWRFRANAWSPSGMFTLIISWSEITSSGIPRKGTVPLYDDGLHDDGGSLDGVFAGDWETPLPAGTSIEFYITGTDLAGESSTEPDAQQFTTSGQPTLNYTLSIPAIASGWEISEVVPRNQGGLRDEGGSSPDWAEIRYTGAGTISAQGLFLSDSLFGFTSADLYDVARQGANVDAGTSHIVFLDDTPVNAGGDPRHAPFKLSGEGDTLYLLRLLPSGATQFVDWVKVPPMQPNVAYARLGPGGSWVQTIPTPDAPNASNGTGLFLVTAANGVTEAVVVFKGSGRIEASSNLINWTTVYPTVPDNGFEHSYRELKFSKRFFRVR